MRQRVWWFTGLSGSGKTTTALDVKNILDFMGQKCIILDGDIVRTGLCADLKFTEEDRLENLRRVAYVARMFWDEDYNVICSFVSPTEEGRNMVFDIMSGMDVSLVYFSTPLEECERRDVKGLYKKARAGEIENFTGIGQEYEVSESPDFIIDTREKTVREAALELVYS